MDRSGRIQKKFGSPNKQDSVVSWLGEEGKEREVPGSGLDSCIGAIY